MSQVLEFAATVIKNLPEMSSDVMQGWVENPAALQKFLMGLCPADIVQPSFRYDKRKSGWKLLENTPRRLTSANNIEAVSFLKKGEGCIGGEELIRRARTEFYANLGQEDAEFMLEHQAEIPKELRKYYLVFPGTIWRDSSERRCVPCLDWDGVRWVLFFFWLGGDWYSSGRLVRPCK